MRFKTRATRFGPFAAALCVATAAQAGRPFVTEDAGVLARGACEWEGLSARVAASGSPSESAWATQVGCGIGLASQLALGYGRSHAGDERASAYALGGKTGLVDGGNDALALTLAWGLNWARAGGGTAFDNALLNLAATRPFGGGWSLHANLGLLRQREPRDTLTSWALAVEKRVVDGLDLGAEVYREGSGKPWFGVGLRWQLAERVGINASAAVQNESPRVRLLTLGFKLEY